MAANVVGSLRKDWTKQRGLDEGCQLSVVCASSRYVSDN